MQIAVGGCLAQKDRGEIVRRAPWVDVVFGTHNIGKLPLLLERARIEEQAQVEIAEALEQFPSTLPTRRDSAYAAWVSISVGCNNTCTFCIVPSLRGRETDRRPGEILAEIEMLVADGVQEITLLGQNVNAYGSEFGDRQAFAKLLRACGQIEGLERVRFTSPHPARLHRRRDRGDGRDAQRHAAAAYAAAVRVGRRAPPDAALVPQRPVPADHRRTYGGPCRKRRSRPTSSSAFPGRPRPTSPATLDVVAASRFAAAFTFQYSIRAGTPAATMPDQVPKAVVQERYERLVELVGEIAWRENLAQVGRTVEVLFADGEGRKDAATARMSGRARDNRLVHVAVPDDPGSVRDPATWPRRRSATPRRTTSTPTTACSACAGPAVATPGRPGMLGLGLVEGRPTVGLGMPSIGAPAPLTPVAACSTSA